MISPDIERPHPVDPNGQHRLYFFDNGYGASVVRFRMPSNQPRLLFSFACEVVGQGAEGGEGSYGYSEGKWELAVIIWKDKEGNEFELTYKTPITDDVIGHLDEDEVQTILKRIRDLPKREVKMNANSEKKEKS